MSFDLSPRARLRLRRLGVVALVVAAVGALAWLGLGLVLDRVLDEGRLARWGEARMSTSLNRDVGLEEVSLSVFPRPAVELTGLRVANPPGFETPALLRIERAQLQIALWPLLRREAVVEEVRLVGADVRLTALEDGRTNYGDFVPAGEPTGPDDRDPPLRIRMEEIRVEDGAFSYGRAASGLELTVQGIAGRASLSRRDEARQLELDVRADTVGVDGLPGGRTAPPLSGRLAAEGRLADDRLILDSGRVELGELAVRVAGSVDSLSRPIRRLALRVEADSVDAGALSRLLGRSGGGPEGSPPEERASVEGRLALDLDLRGGWGPDRRPEVDGLLRLRDGQLTSSDGVGLADDLTAEVQVGGDSLVLAGLEGRFLDGSLRSTGALRLDSARAWRLDLRASPVADRIAAARGVDTSLVDGAVAADLALRGRGSQAGAVRVEGTVRPLGLEVARPGWIGSLRLSDGTVELAGDSAVARAVQVVVAEDTLSVELTASGVPSRLIGDGPVPSIRGRLRGGRLDLDGLLGRERPDSVSWSRLALARLGGRRAAGRAPEELTSGRSPLADPLPVAGTVRVELDELIRRPHRLGEVSLDLELAAGRIAVSDARFTFLGGRGEGSAEIATGSSGPAPFGLRLQATGVSVADLLATSTPVGRLMTGTGDLELDVSGRLDSLLLPVVDGMEGGGRLVVRDGRLRPNPVTRVLADALRAPGLRNPELRSWELPFRLAADSLVLEPSSPQGLPLPLRIGGSLGLGGRLGLAVTGEVDRDAARALAERTGDLPGSLFDRIAGDRPLPIALRVVGTVDSPRVRVDAEALRDAMERAARDEAGETARRGARSLLERLLGEEQETAPDSAAPDSAASDTTDLRTGRTRLFRRPAARYPPGWRQGCRARPAESRPCVARRAPQVRPATGT